jgi:protein gp37
MSTKIQWCDETWNPVIGCSHASPGCDHCYAERMAERLAWIGNRNYLDVLQCEYGGAPLKWNGKTVFVESALDKPLRWKRPRRIFVCSMGDLFHESVPFRWIDRVFAVMALCPQHTFILCTKRAERMHRYIITSMYIEHSTSLWEAIDDRGGNSDISPPFRNVIGMVTADDQEQWDKRVPWLLKTPFALRGVSIEPMLEKIVVTQPELIPGHGTGWANPMYSTAALGDKRPPSLDWVIVGGESGPGARPMHPYWVRRVRDDCVAAGTEFFFKQWGDRPHIDAFDERDGMINACYGNKHNGRVLDGRTWDEFPETEVK